MLTIKCPSCGHRNLSSSILKICTNCGGLLPTPTTSPARPEEPPSVIRMPASSRSPSHAQQTSLSQTDESLPYSLSPGERQLQSYPYDKENWLQKYQEDTQIQPALDTRYQLSTEFEPAEAITTIVTGQARPEAFPTWMTDKLPFGFPRRPPDLFGTVIHVQSQYERATSFDMSGSFLKQLRDSIWTVSYEQSNPQKDEVLVTTVRLHTSSGKQEDIRLHGYLRKANIALGDTISLWGRKRNGAFAVRRAYNHTSKGPITTNALASPFSLPFVLLVLAAAVVLMSHFMHINIPFLPRLF